MSGQLSKPVTTSDVLISVKYQNALGEWISAWCKTLYAANVYNENLNATFELPASASSGTYNLKVELISETNNFNIPIAVTAKQTYYANRLFLNFIQFPWDANIQYTHRSSTKR